jgi:CheY-like chemotaxis protein
MSKKILVTDDDEMMRHVLTLLLTPCGHELSEAADGEEAMERLKEGPFDLVISDILMRQ